MQESNLINQNARKVAVKVLVKDDVPLFLQPKQNPLYQKGSYYHDPKSDLFLYDQIHKNLPKYGKNFQQSMLSLCQQYNTSVQLFPYFNYYNHSAALAASLAASVASEEEITQDRETQ